LLSALILNTTFAEHGHFYFIATSELLVANPKTLARVVRPTDAVLPLIEPDTLFCTPSTASLCDTTPTTSSSTSLLT
jgi:hypothetical protein